MELSLVIPLYNEQILVDELVERISTSLGKIPGEVEILFVDDGSTDNTVPKLLVARERDPRIKILRLSRNFGHPAAFTAGLTHACGKFVVMMDGDLQDPPELIPGMYRMVKSGDYDIVSGKRTDPKVGTGQPRVNRWFHRLFGRLTGFDDMENSGNFSMFNSLSREAILQYPENIRYLPGLRKLVGFKQGYIEYVRQVRQAGESKMRFVQLVTLSSDALFSFSKFPIRLCLYLGIIGVLIFFLAGFYTLIAKIAGFALLGWSSTLLSIYFLGSIQLVFLGILGEYIYRIYKESQRRPLFFVKEFIQ